MDESDARDVRLAAGELSLHNVDIVHGSKPNRSTGKRIGFAVRYVAPKVRQVLRHHEVILARGRDEYGHYQLLTAPPGPSFEESLRAQSEFAVRWRKVRFGN